MTTRRTRKRRKHTKVLVTNLPIPNPVQCLLFQNIVKYSAIIHKVGQNYLLVFEVKVMQQRVNFINRYVHISWTQWKIEWNHQHWKTPFFRWAPPPPSLPLHSSIQPGGGAITCCSKLLGIAWIQLWSCSLTRQAMYVYHDTETYLCNHCCSEKAIIITYSECVFVALGIQHAKT